MENKTEKKNMPLFILKIVGNVVFYLVIAALLLFSIMNINGGAKNEGFPNIFGKGILSVQSQSMTGDNEDSFVKGDLLLVDVFNSKDFNSLEVGDVVTFYDTNIKALNTHRIVYISKNAEGTIVSVAVQGDLAVKEYGAYNPETTEPSLNKWLEDQGHVSILSANQIKGVMTGKINGAGKVLDNLQDYWLFYFVLPVLAFLLFEVFMVIKNVMALQNERNKGANKDSGAIDIEAEREAIRAQILAELKAEQEKKAQEEKSE